MSEEFKKEEINGEAAEETKAAEHTEEVKAETTAEQTRRLHEKLEKVTGRHIDLKTKVEPAVLGGIRLDIEGTELDGTVRSRLAGLRSSIAAATL